MKRSDEEIASALKDILARPEFQEDPWIEAWRRFLEQFRDLMSWFSHLDPWILWFLVLVCLATLIGLFLFHFLPYRQAVQRSHKTIVYDEHAMSHGESPADLIAYAHHLIEQNDFRSAARTLQRASLLHFCQRDGIQWQANLTDWEWIARFNHDPKLVDFTKHTQHVAYGTHPTREQIDSCLSAYHQLVGKSLIP